jgi:hypothetical protein
MFVISWLMDLSLELGRYLIGSPRSRIRQMRALRRLNDHLLADIGLARHEVRKAYPPSPARLPWQDPFHCREPTTSVDRLA